MDYNIKKLTLNCYLCTIQELVSLLIL